MQLTHNEIHYTTDESIFQIHKKLSNGIQIKSYIVFVTEYFRDYQKDILQENIAELAEKISMEHYDLDVIKDTVEQSLQSLNTNLKGFADKMDTVQNFQLKGFVQIIVDNVLITSLIGDVSLMILRNNKLYYSSHNATTLEGKIDIFSDFIEGDIESHDQIMYVGTKITDVLDDVDVQTLEASLTENNGALLSALQQLLQTRIDDQHVGFLAHCIVKGSSTRVTTHKTGFEIPKINSAKILKYKTLLFTNKYYVSVGVLGILILFLFYHVLAQMIQVNQPDVMFTDEGLLVDVTIDDIKKDIQIFLSMDPTSDAKGQKYHETIQKLQTLEERGRWLEDVAQLRSIIQKNYYQGFNIYYINNLNAFSDTAGSSQLFAFNNAEKNALGDLTHINYTNNVLLAGTKGALVGLINNSVRGSLIDFGLTIPMLGCSSNLLRNGLYCFTNQTIYNVTNAGIETLTTTDESFPEDIDGVDVYGKVNMYIFHKGFVAGTTGSTFVTRYRNMLGSQTQFQAGQSNAVLMTNPIGFNEGFASYAIDGSFFSWSKTDAKLYQFWREGTSTLLSVRAVPLQGGDKLRSNYSKDVIVHTAVNTRYVYLLDRENQTFTVYDSSPLKDADVFRRDFSLRYLFRFQFDLAGENIIDFVVPEAGGNRPELYLLTNNGVYKVRLHEFIDSVASGALKQLGNE